MADFGGLLVFGIVVGLIIAGTFAVLYCGYVTICIACKKRQNPLAESENPV